jgi:GNAT superfamily N-acetyltransferase
VSRRLVDLTLDNLVELPAVDGCSPSEATAREEWVRATLLEWGTCGTLLLIDGCYVGFALYAPSGYVPRSGAFPTAPVSSDAVLLTEVYVMAELRGQGLGRLLSQSVARAVIQRGIRAIEAFGRYQDDGEGCVLPVDYLVSVGFKVLREHRRTPRLRLDIRSLASWREDVESVLGRLITTVTPGAPAPSLYSGTFGNMAPDPGSYCQKSGWVQGG